MWKVPSASEFRGIFSSALQDIPNCPLESLPVFLGLGVVFFSGPCSWVFEPSGLSALPGPESCATPAAGSLRTTGRLCLSPGAGLLGLSAAPLAVAPNSLSTGCPNTITHAVFHTPALDTQLLAGRALRRRRHVTVAASRARCLLSPPPSGPAAPPGALGQRGGEQGVGNCRPGCWHRFPQLPFLLPR